MSGLACKDDFLSRFAATGEHSDGSLRNVVTNFVLAGRGTTSSALTWFFWMVSGRPDVEDKIVRASSVSTDAAFGFDELREMHYLHAAITESMRLYPPMAMDSHCYQHDDRLPTARLLAKGGRSPTPRTPWRCWRRHGARTARSSGGSTLNDDGTFRPESPFKYPIFHAGPRMCLGMEMAYIQTKSIVACVFGRFSFRFVRGEQRPGLVFCVRR